jgi:hypothetical protein
MCLRAHAYTASEELSADIYPVELSCGLAVISDPVGNKTAAPRVAPTWKSGLERYTIGWYHTASAKTGGREEPLRCGACATCTAQIPSP